MNLIVSKFMWKNGSRINQYMFAVLLTIPLLNFGMIQGWLSPMLQLLQSSETPSPEPYTKEDLSWVASVTYITAIVFGAPMGYLTDRFGRKAMTLMLTLSLIVYWLIKICCLQPWALILARAVAGIPCSACYIVLPIYLKEISDIDLRGALGSLLILNRNVGYLISYICADFMDVKTLFWFSMMVPCVVFLLFLGMPETPEYLIKQGKVEEAKAVLAWLRGVTLVDKTLDEDIEKLVVAEKGNKAEQRSAWSVILSDRTTFKAFTITLVIKLAQQFDGYLIVLIFAGHVFRIASETMHVHLSPNTQVMLVGGVQLLGSIVATCIVEKTGRKLLLVATSFAMGVGMLCLGGWFFCASAASLPGWIPVLAMCVCIFADAAGFQPVSYIIITDLFAFPLRGTVSAFANICAKLLNFVQTKWFYDLCQIIGMHWTFIMFSLVCFAGCFYSMFFFPETRGKTVDEIYENLSGKKKKENNDSPEA